MPAKQVKVLLKPSKFDSLFQILLRVDFSNRSSCLKPAGGYKQLHSGEKIDKQYQSLSFLSAKPKHHRALVDLG